MRTDRPYVNEAVRTELRVANFDECGEPEFPNLPNCTVRYVGQSSGSQVTQIGRGRPQVERYLTFSYTLVPHKAGELTIPAIPVVVDGKTLKTKPRKLTVRQGPQSARPRGGRSDDADSQSDELLLAEITCDQPKLFVGQRGKFRLAIWIRRAEFNRDRLDLSEMLRFLTGTFGPFDTRNFDRHPAKRRLPDGSTEVYYVLELPADFILDQPGPLTFDAVSIRIDYPLQVSRNFFNDLRVHRKRRVHVRPTVAVPDVQPLPREGRPLNFSGAVGQFKLNVFALPTNVRVGDPIQLTIDIRGDPVATLPAPDLTSIPQLVEDFRVPTETLAGTVSGNRKRFTQTIRAKRANVKEIPPIEFAYFDPKAEEYAVARSEPIPILVSAVEQLNAADLTGIAAQPPREHNGVVEARDGLRGNKTSEGELLATVRTVTVTQVTLTTVVPPLAFMCVWGCVILARSGRDYAARRRRGALRNAERRIQVAVARRLPPGEFHSEIEAALAGYLADRLNEPPARFLGRAAVTFLQERGVNQELVQRCAELLERCEHAAYGGASDGDTSLADLARQCARQLERERL
ncbi:MAG: BatD family protein [Phycisphaerae bacterium]